MADHREITVHLLTLFVVLPIALLAFFLLWIRFAEEVMVFRTDFGALALPTALSLLALGGYLWWLLPRGAGWLPRALASGFFAAITTAALWLVSLYLGWIIFGGAAVL